ncbi:hypothetical protein FDI91_gp167 [Salmonella phage STML-13-1]|uniref:Uncharacterized protein n=1 Tax=Salmonella phage STML-13-1 TaxID=1204530 RepID=K4I2U3_9CAUD|nr:hypothetical protein FDI91_gp167 [Salmonella phage STML-13-1]AFU64306.1 hypothetical protein [Salmonella phage STML-13-1]
MMSSLNIVFTHYLKANPDYHVAM